MHAMVNFTRRGLYLSENTLAFGIGEAGMALIDDVQCFGSLYTSLVESFPSMKDRVLWLLVAHMLVRPGIIEALRNLVCIRGVLPTVDGISEVIGQLSRRHGLVPSRMKSGERDWKQVDVFCLASTQTLGVHYCGSHKLYAQLKEFDGLERIAASLSDMKGKDVYFHEIVHAIGRENVTGYARLGYWTTHFARVLMPDFTGVRITKEIQYSTKCAKILRNMGSGAQSMKLLGITDDDVLEKMLSLCQCIEAVGRAYGFHVRMGPAMLACAVCESHRRDVLGTGAMSRRKGL